MSQHSDDSDQLEPFNAQTEDGWEDLEPDYEPQSVVCLFSKETFDNVNTMLQHCEDHYKFDLKRTRNELGLDFLETIKLINYLRSETQHGRIQTTIPTKEIFKGDEYLKPVLEDDPLLYSLDDLDEPGLDDDMHPARDQLQELREELEHLQTQFSDYRNDIQKSLRDRFVDDENLPTSGKAASSEKAMDADYFSSYSYNTIHELMLKDTVRTDAYRDFIYEHKHLFKDKVILDVGCGTGILSMFCAKAGAKLVVAVDNSDIIDRARANVFDNGLQDVIKCMRGKIEEVQLPVAKVDIIVSEWMGYCLFFEAMFDSVIWARDHYLAPDGLMVPSHASLNIAPLADSDLVAEHIDFWHDVYGFKMASMLENVYDEPLIRSIEPSGLAGPANSFLELDLHTTKQEDLDFVKEFSLTINGDHSMLDGFVIWFDIFFMPKQGQSVPKGSTPAKMMEKGIVSFTTGPEAKQTHWQQGVLLIDRQLSKGIPLKDGQIVSGHIAYRKKEAKTRMLDIEVSWSSNQEGKVDPSKQAWSLGW